MTTDTVNQQQQAPAAAEAVAKTTFVDRMSNLPVMTSAYDRAMRYSPYLTGKVNQVSKPLISSLVSYEPINNLGNKQLDFLENTFPIIQQEPEQIITASKTYVNSVGETLLNKSAMVVDRYLPDTPAAPSENGQAPKEEAAQATAEQKALTTRALNLGFTIKGRLHRKMVTSLDNLKLRPASEVANMNFTVDLIKYAQDNLDKQTKMLQEALKATQEKFKYEELKKNTEQIVATSTESAKAMEQKLRLQIATFSTNIRNIVVTTSDSLRTYVPVLPASIQQNIDQLKAKVAKQLEAIPENSLDKEIARLSQIGKDSIEKLQHARDYVMDFLSKNVGIKMLVSQPNAQAQIETDDELSSTEPTSAMASTDVSDDDGANTKEDDAMIQ